MSFQGDRGDRNAAEHVPLDDAALFARAVSREMLSSGWQKVWSNGGAAGGDGVSLQKFQINASGHLRRLRQELQAGSYRPAPLRRVEIPKRDGGRRPLDIPAIIDRIAQTAVSAVLTPLLDAEFEPSSFGYRPGRSVAQAVDQIAMAQRAGYGWVVDADIERYFEQIPHDALMERWAESISPGPLTELVSLWLTHAMPEGRGIAQGSPLSPLLANLYLDRMDEAFAGHAARIVRFADDFVILCKSAEGAESALEKASGLLDAHGLQLNREKSRVISFDRGFSFLGHLFVRSLTLKQAGDSATQKQAEDWMREIAEREGQAAARQQAEEAQIADQRQRGYAPGLRVLYVRGADRRLNIRNWSFCVEQGSGRLELSPDWQELIAIPHQDVDRIEIWPGVQVTDEAERHALATDTPIAFVNGWGQTIGWITAPIAPRAGRHLAQARVCLDETARLNLARCIVDARLRNQRALLRRLIRGRTVPAVVATGLTRLNRLIRQLPVARDISAVMGYEGAGAAAWWPAISALMRPEMRFATRKRERGNADPANIMMNFLSALLARDIGVAVMRAGLHPGFGVLHSSDNHRDACVYDLMEEFRAHFIGGLAVYCVNRQMVRKDMFLQTTEGWQMQRAAGDALIRAYEARVERQVKNPASGKKVSWRQLMVEQAFAFATCIEGDEMYRPYIMDY